MNYLNLGIAAAVVFTLSLTHAFVYRAGQNQVQVKWEVEKLSHAHALIAQESAHRAQERKWGESITSLTDWHRGAQERLQDEYEVIIADTASGALRLRDDLRGCRAKLPGDTPTPSGDHGTSSPGLSPERQGVALRAWAECDAVALKLTAAQEYIRAILATP